MNWKTLLAACCFVLLATPVFAQGASPELLPGGCGTANYTYSTAYFTVDSTGKECVNATVSASVTGFTPNLSFATLTATGSSASVALPTGTTVYLQNNGTTTVSCTLGIGSATATANEILIPASSGVPVVVGSNTFAACIDQTGSASNLVVLAGGSGLANAFGGGSSGSGGAVFGPTAVGSAAANPPVLIGGTANATATGNVQVAKVDSNGTQFIDCSAIGNTICGAITAAPTLGSASGGLSTNLQTNLLTSVVAVDASAGQLYELYCYNPNASAAFVQIFDLATGSVTPGTTVPKLSYGIPSTNAAGFTVSLVGTQFSTAISAIGTTTVSGATAPSSGLNCNFKFK